MVRKRKIIIQGVAHNFTHQELKDLQELCEHAQLEMRLEGITRDTINDLLKRKGVR